MDKLKDIIDSNVKYIKNDPGKVRFSYDLKLAKMHPKGQEAYFNELKYEIYKNLNDNNTIGHNWIGNDFPDPFKTNGENGIIWIEAFIYNWIQVDVIKYLTENGLLLELKYGNPEEVIQNFWESNHKYKDQIRPFLEEYFYLEMIKNYLVSLNTTSVQKDKKIINSASTELPVKEFRLKDGVDKILVVKYYNWLKNKKKSIKCTDIEFTSVFSNDELPEGWKPLVWTDNKSALAAVILDLLIVPKSKPGIEKMKQFFVDEKGNHVEPALRLSKNNLDNYRPGTKDL